VRRLLHCNGWAEPRAGVNTSRRDRSPNASVVPPAADGVVRCRCLSALCQMRVARRTPVVRVGGFDAIGVLGGRAGPLDRRPLRRRSGTLVELLTLIFAANDPELPRHMIALIELFVCAPALERAGVIHKCPTRLLRNVTRRGIARPRWSPPLPLSSSCRQRWQPPRRRSSRCPLRADGARP
jgi:hypothetical protein